MREVEEPDRLGLEHTNFGVRDCLSLFCTYIPKYLRLGTLCRKEIYLTVTVLEAQSPKLGSSICSDSSDDFQSISQLGI